MIALARKYRPRRFADLLVQDHVAAALRGAVEKDRVAQGYLLTGPRGVGKTTAARILAMALNCERRDRGGAGEPCGECSTCQRIWTGSANLDVVEIDAASNRSVDDARDLRERAMYAASQEGGYKVYIVDEAHMLTREAWNALLKILEEPPPRVVFVFATTEPQKIANTAAPVLSRLQRFDFRRIGVPAIRERLEQILAAEGLSADADALAVIARYADGGMRDALSVLDQALSLADGPLTADRVRQALGLISDDVYAEVLRAVAAKQPGAIFPVVDRLLMAGADLVEFMGGLADLLRAVLMTQTGAAPEGLTGAQREVIGQVEASLGVGDVLRMLALQTEAETSIRRSANPRLVVETLLLRWAMMDRTLDLAQVLGSRGEGVGPVSGAPEARQTGGPTQAQRPMARPGPAVESARAVPSLQEASVGALRGAWSEIVALGRAKGPLLGAVLEALTPSGVEGRVVTLAVGGGDQAHMLEGARRQQGAIAALLGEAGLAGCDVVIVSPTQPATVEKPKRLSDKELKGERLKEIRTRDGALDAAVEALDLEIVE